MYLLVPKKKKEKKEKKGAGLGGFAHFNL